MHTEITPDYSVPAHSTGDATALNAASSTRPTVVVTTPPQPMTESELREVAAQEEAIAARQNAENAAYARAHTHEGEAVTGTGQGDNRDETGDPDIAAGLGGLGGAIVGAAAGSMLGPAGALAGAVVGGLAVGGLSGVAVDAIDKTDDDTTFSGLSSQTSTDATRTTDRTDNDGPVIV